MPFDALHKLYDGAIVFCNVRYFFFRVVCVLSIILLTLLILILVGLVAKGIYDAVENAHQNRNGNNAKVMRPISMNGFSEVALNRRDQGNKN